MSRPEPVTDDPLTPEELERWTAWKHASDVVLERVRREVRTATGLSNADFGVLSIVADARWVDNPDGSRSLTIGPPVAATESQTVTPDDDGDVGPEPVRRGPGRPPKVRTEGE